MEDGKTHSNKWELDCKDVVIQCEGECVHTKMKVSFQSKKGILFYDDEYNKQSHFKY